MKVNSLFLRRYLNCRRNRNFIHSGSHFIQCDEISRPFSCPFQNYSLSLRLTQWACCSALGNACWSKKGERVGHRWTEATKPFVGLASKGRFLNVIFCAQISQIWHSQKISQRSVHAGCIISRCMEAIIGSLHYLYNTRWRGLAELLILGMGNARAWARDKRQKVSPAPFLFPYTLSLGEQVGTKW